MSAIETLKKARQLLREKRKTIAGLGSVQIHLDSAINELETAECEHPYYAVNTRCMGEINYCLKCSC